MKGIVLAGGSGSRLFPITLGVCKQLLPVFDKPMIYYPLSVLMLAGIKEILIISTPQDLPRIQKLFGTGQQLGLKLSYAEQQTPKGIAEAFLIGKEFIGKEPVCLILGDNFFYGHDFSTFLKKGQDLLEGGVIFGYHVQNPSQYGVVEFDPSGRVLSIEEKPKNPKSSYAIPGLYFYGPEVVSIAEQLKPSLRGELEITDIHAKYLEKDKLHVSLLGRGYAWLDMGTYDSLQKASLLVQVIQERQGIQIACLEEIAYRMGWIDQKMLLKTLSTYPEQNEYVRYLKQLLE